jgi:hypothetical protein
MYVELAEQAFRKLKEEVGKDPDFEYPEYILEVNYYVNVC